MITSLKTAFACWIGIFLILPGCLCQLLACVGIGVHGESGRDGEQTEIGAPSLLASLDCHCDEDTGKVAETSPTNLQPEQPLAFIRSIGDASLLPLSAPLPRSLSARAPPSVPSATASDFRALVSVWLI